MENVKYAIIAVQENALLVENIGIVAGVSNNNGDGKETKCG